ncbi:hypothetical protein L228DRAFT_249713, partial [Xylona heveae TC161]
MSSKLRPRAQRNGNSGGLFVDENDRSAPSIAYEPAIKPDVDAEVRIDDDDFEAEDGEEEEDDGTYEPKTAISEPMQSQRRIGEIIRILNSRYLELSPDYQRGVVWNESRMSALIESFIENFYVPPVIFNVVRLADEGDEARYKRICVDGKQRLTSIREFLAGNIPIRDKHGRKWYYVDNGNGKSGRRVLPESAKHQFRNKSVVCYEYQDMGREHEEDLFARVQEGVTLTAAEKLRATSGPWQSFIKDYEEDYPTVAGLIKNKRSGGFRSIASCFAQIVAVRTTPKGRIPAVKSSESVLEALFKQTYLLTEDAQELFREVFNLFARLIRDWPHFLKEHDTLKHTKSFSPIEFSAVGVLLSLYYLHRGRAQLAEDIHRLRIVLRENFTELKLNKRTWEFVWDYIDGIQKLRDEAPIFSTPKPPAQAKGIAAGDESTHDALPASGKASSLTRQRPRKSTAAGREIDREAGERPPLSRVDQDDNGDGGAGTHAQPLDGSHDNDLTRNLGQGLSGKKPKLARFNTSEGNTGGSGRAIVPNGDGRSRGGVENNNTPSARLHRPDTYAKTPAGAPPAPGQAPVADMGRNDQSFSTAQSSTPLSSMSKRRLAQLESSNDTPIKRTKGLAARPRF